MSPRSLAALACAYLVLAGAEPSAAASDLEGPRVRVELLSEVGAIAPGQTFWVALHQRIAPGWHTYWVNPGDSGEPLRIEWALPPGFAAGEIAWPFPERIQVGSAMTYGYSSEVVLPIQMTPPAGLPPGSRVTLRGHASWLVCEKTCIPEDAAVALTLPVVAGVAPPDPRGGPLIAAARRNLPTPSPWPASFVATSEDVTLTIKASGLMPERITEVWFYPARWGAIELAAPQRARVDSAGIRVDVARGPLRDAVVAPIDGVLVLAERLDGGVARHAFSVTAPPRSFAGDQDTSAAALLRAIALALAGGLLLNLMPCVLPVLSVKGLGLVRHATGPPAKLRVHGLAYAAGVLVSFAAVAGALIALRAGGEQLGWGFQLQSPAFVTLLAWLFFAVALSFSGLIVVGGRFAGIGQVLAARAGYGGSFAAGALATVAATPCTAPFMGAAVGFAVAQSWPIALLVFEALGLGLALPYLLLTFVPTWSRLLPKPGPWMARLQQLLAFPLYASAAWLVWVVSQQAGPHGVGAALAGLVLIAFAAWLHQALGGARALWRHAATWTVAALLPLLIVGIVTLGPLAAGTPSSARAVDAGSRLGWEPFTPERLATLRASGKPVFVNFTAAWCVTCLVNERVALRSPAIADAFAKKGVTALKADWTNRDPAITQMLASLGRSGVPLYVLYQPGAGAGATPTVLPQILTEGAVIDALDKI
ncbi:MAG: protein-disulfide reductase DsbD family protein [Candidatus Rokuibacteriota bacterium]